MHNVPIHKGSFNNYVDRFLALFDHPSTSRRQFIYWSLLTCVDIWLTTHPPCPVYVVVACPLILSNYHTRYCHKDLILDLIVPKDLDGAKGQYMSKILSYSSLTYLNFHSLFLSTSVAVPCVTEDNGLGSLSFSKFQPLENTVPYNTEKVYNWRRVHRYRPPVIRESLGRGYG